MHKVIKNEIRYYYESNIFFKYIFGKTEKHNRRFTIIIMASYLILYIVCKIDGTLKLSHGNIGFLTDLVFYTFLLIQIFMIAGLNSLFHKMNRLLDTSDCSLGIIRIIRNYSLQSQDYIEQFRKIKNKISLHDTKTRQTYWCFMIFWFVFILIFQVYIPIFKPQHIKSWAIWPQQYLFSFVFSTIYCLLSYGIVIGNIFWYVASSAIIIFSYIHKLVKDNDIEVIPVSPDGKGGLASLGNVSFTIALIAAQGLLFSVSWIIIYGIDLPSLIGLPAYFIVLILLFFGPLQSVHRAMKEAKNHELFYLSELFRVKYNSINELEDISACAKNKRNKGIFEELSYFEQLYHRAELMPVWPFDASTIRRFFSLIIIPLLVFLFQLFTQNALTKIMSNYTK